MTCPIPLVHPLMLSGRAPADPLTHCPLKGQQGYSAGGGGVRCSVHKQRTMRREVLP